MLGAERSRKMAKKIKETTRLKRGDIVRYPSGDNFFVGIVVRHEKFLENSGHYAFNIMGPKGQADKELTEAGVDMYQRHHIKDLTRSNAELISPEELMLMYKNALTTIRTIKKYDQKPSYLGFYFF